MPAYRRGPERQGVANATIKFWVLRGAGERAGGHCPLRSAALHQPLQNR